MKTIRQEVTFNASPEVIFEMLMDSRKHSEFTGEKADISREVGGKIAAYDGYISGHNTELVQNRKIVQSWRGSEWPEGHYSSAKFELEEVEHGTKLTFTQTDVPDDQYDSISEGWIEQYWDKMKKVLSKPR